MSLRRGTERMVRKRVMEPWRPEVFDHARLDNTYQPPPQREEPAPAAEELAEAEAVEDTDDVENAQNELPSAPPLSGAGGPDPLPANKRPATAAPPPERKKRQNELPIAARPHPPAVGGPRERSEQGDGLPLPMVGRVGAYDGESLTASRRAGYNSVCRNIGTIT